LATLIGLFLGIYGGVKFSDITSNYLTENFEIDIPLVAFGVTFLGILIAVYLLGQVLSKFASALSLGLFNNLAGAIFGAGKAIIILSVALFFFENFNQTFHFISEEVLEKSELYGFLKDTKEIVFPYFEELKKNANN
jgi:uncharacterized membrane protein required for colicin V production